MRAFANMGGLRRMSTLPRIQLEIDPELKDAFFEKLREEGYTAAGWVRKQIKDYLGISHRKSV